MASESRTKRNGDGGSDSLVSVAELFRRWAREEPQNSIAANAKDGSILVYVPPGEFGDG